MLLTLVVAGASVDRLAALLGLALGLGILGNVRLAALPLLVAGVRRRAHGRGPPRNRARRRDRRSRCRDGDAVARAQPRLCRVHGGHDGRAGALEGEQRQHVRHADPRGLDRRGAALSRRAATPEDVYERYLVTGVYTPVDECAQMRFFEHKAHAFWFDHPREKAKLALLSAQMLWQPSVVETGGRPGEDTWLDTLRSSSEPVFVVPLYSSRSQGSSSSRELSRVLTVLLLAYQTAVAMIFVGVTRYRVPWDFLLAFARGHCARRAREAAIGCAATRCEDRKS